MFKFIGLLKYVFIAILPVVIFIMFIRCANGNYNGFSVLDLRYYFQDLDFNPYISDIQFTWNDVLDKFSTWGNNITSFDGFNYVDINSMESFFENVGIFFSSLFGYLGYTLQIFGLIVDFLSAIIIIVVDSIKLVVYVIGAFFGFIPYILSV